MDITKSWILGVVVVVVVVFYYYFINVFAYLCIFLRQKKGIHEGDTYYK